MDPDEVTAQLASLDEAPREAAPVAVVGVEADGSSNTGATLAQQFAVIYARIAGPHLRVEVLGPDRVAICDVRDD